MKKWHIVSNILIVQEHLGRNEFSGTDLMDKSLNELIAILGVLTAQLLNRRGFSDLDETPEDSAQADPEGVNRRVFPHCFEGTHSEGASDD